MQDTFLKKYEDMQDAVLKHIAQRDGNAFDAQVIWRATGAQMMRLKGEQGLLQYLRWALSVDRSGVHDVEPTVDVRDYRVNFLGDYAPDRDAIVRYIGDKMAAVTAPL